MRNKLLLVVAMILVVGWCSVQAGNGNRVGTAGAQELLIPVGSRGVALGGSIVANASGVDAIHWNPAGLGYIYEGTQAMFSHQSYIADIDVEYAAAATHIEDFGVIGLSVKVVDIGEIEETTEAYPNGTGTIFNPTMTVLGLTWSKPLTSNVNFGFTTKYMREKIFDVEATGFALDFGFTYESRYRGLSFGFVMRNYGPDMKFEGPGFDRTYEDVGKRPVSSDNSTFELPTSINLGMAFNFLSNGPNMATLTGNFRANNQADDYWQGGMEYSYDEKYFIRGGYKYSVQEGFIYGASFGAGLVFPVGNSNLSFEYSWAETDEIFDNNQFFTVGVEF